MASFNRITLLALLGTACAKPIVLDITADEFSKRGSITMSPRASNGGGNGTYTEITSTTEYSYTLVGDGTPHQNYIITQQAGLPISCGPGANTGISKSTTTGWTVGVGGGSMAAPEGEVGAFNPFSFSVSESVTTGTSMGFGCTTQGNNACILAYVAVTAYTVNVDATVTGPEGGTSVIPQGTQIIYAPNSNGVGTVLGRGVNIGGKGINQCVGDVDRVINAYCGPPGGPEWWDGKAPLGPFNPDYLAQREPADCQLPIEASQFNDP